MQYTVGAYAASPNHSGWDAALETEFYNELKKLANLKGLEHPFLGRLHQHDDDWFLANINPQWDYVFTCIPGIMNALSQNPLFGLASDDASGRAEALAFMQQACAAIGKLNAHLGRPAVTAIQIQTAPARYKAASSRAALMASLKTMLEWDWQGARIVIEHCDAYVAEHLPSKGFLALQDELEVLTALNATLAQSQQLGMVINWGRSVFETRRIEGAVEHIQAAQHAGLLRGLMFSGVSDQDSDYGAWRDSHQPPQHSHLIPHGEPGSWMTEQAIHACLAASNAAVLPVLGAKIGIRPHSAGIDQRVATISDTLAILDRYFAV
uniref:Chemotaxis protein, resembles cheA n=1 Tax=Rheinheimera sp. BAL341 TaxID=1708203 RepID=A0A486XK74_9GAMM